jgi:N-acetylmuramic acid 6-phosphate (MurNAc-6-P) etherase
MTTQADKQHRISVVMNILKVDASKAEDYLEMEEWDIYDAIESYRADHK